MNGSYRNVDGELHLLEQNSEFLFPVEIWMLNDKDNRNNWRFVNLEQHRASWSGVPILCAYVNGGRTYGDGHNQATRFDQDGRAYQSFTDATAERIVGSISDDEADVRIEERDGAQWVVGKGTLWAWYASELVRQIADDAKQDRVMSVSIEALVTESHMDGDIEVETAYMPLGVTLLGHGVEPAVEDAHIAMLTEMQDEFKELKLRAASYINKESEESDKPTITKEGVKKSMRLSKQQIREQQPKFADHTVLAGEQNDNGVVTLCLMGKSGTTAVYQMSSLDESVVPERIVTVNAQTHFCADGCEDVLVDACDIVETMSEAAQAAEDRAECAEKELSAAKATIEQMVATENARRLSAAKSKATATLAEFNANREDKIEEKVLSALTADIEAGKFTALCDENGAWVGESAVEEKVLSMCAAAIMEQDKRNAANAPHKMTWGNVKNASAAPGTIGELFASKKN